jgi:hypothetical protein
MPSGLPRCHGNRLLSVIPGQQGPHRVDPGNIPRWFEVQSDPWTAVLWNNVMTDLQR